MKNREIKASDNVGHFCYIPCTHKISDEELAIHICLAQKKTGDIIRILRHNPKATIADISEILGIARSTAGWHLKKLIHANLAMCEYDGKIARYTLTDKAFSLYISMADEAENNESVSA
ncbi:MAG: winged helix-turn-helix domain-containing protein [Methanocorpusculum sp.]|nr:winged helix-turn-helix domain-containing protein [Methanocorpusculum sp.]